MRGGFAIMPHMPAPVIEKLEGVSLNCFSLSKKTVQLPSPVFTNIALAFGRFNVAALNSAVAH